MDGGLVFVADAFVVGADDALAIRIVGEMIACTRQLAIGAIPDHDVVGLDARLFEAFTDGIDKSDARGESGASDGVDL